MTLEHAGGTRHVPQLALPLLFQLPLVEEVLRVKLRSLARKVQAGHLGGAPTANHRGVVFVVPREPRDEPQLLRYVRKQRRDDFRKSPEVDVLPAIRRESQKLADEGLVVRVDAANSLVVPGI